MFEQAPWSSETLRPNSGGERERRREMWCGKMGRKAGRGEMRCHDVRGCNVRGHNRASTTTKVNAAPEGRSATRSGYHRGGRDANQKNRSDANGKLSHNAQLRCPRCVSRGSYLPTC